MIASFVASWALFHDAYLAGWLIAVLLALLGVVVVTRDQIFLGAAVSQASVLGIALAVSVGGLPALRRRARGATTTGPTPIAGGVFAVAGAMLTATAALRRETHESLTGWVYLTASSFAVLLLAHSPHGMDEINRLLASTIIGAGAVDVVHLRGARCGRGDWRSSPAARAAPARADGPRDGERRRGARRRAGIAALAIALGVVVGLAIHVSGVVYSFGCLVLPALVAKNLCREVRQMLWVSPLVALVAAVAGFVVANDQRFAAGAGGGGDPQRALLGGVGRAALAFDADVRRDSATRPTLRRRRRRTAPRTPRRRRASGATSARVGCAVDVAKDRHDRVARGVHPDQPRLERSRVVRAAQAPVARRRQRSRSKRCSRSCDGIWPPVKKWRAIQSDGPRSTIRVGEAPVGEDVDEEHAVRREPAGDAAQQQLVVPHVLEHLDRDDAVEAPAIGGRSAFMSAVTTVEVAKTPRRGGCVDEALLRRRVADRGDRRRAGTARPSRATASPSRSRARGCAGRRRGAPARR